MTSVEASSLGMLCVTSDGNYFEGDNM